MADTIDDIDISCVGELASIKEDRDRLEGYRSRADLLKDKVDAIVYRRVLDDYQTKHRQLDERAAPLTAAARTQYQALVALERRIQTAFQEARLVKEELEFRHAVGEIPDEALAAKVVEPNTTLTTRQAELDAVAAMKARFLGVVASEDVLAGAPPPPPPAPTIVQAPAAPAAAATIVRGPADTNVVAAAPAASHAPSPAAPPAPAAPATSEPTEEGRGVETGARTFLVPEASLEPVDDSTDGARFRLGVVTSIGRSAENHIRLVKAGVSRKHAIIKLTELGFQLEDLGSQNGTFVNGTRVPTHDLTDGDLIWIGDVKVMFKSAWTPPRAAAQAAEAAGGNSLHSSRRSRRS